MSIDLIHQPGKNGYVRNLGPVTHSALFFSLKKFVEKAQSGIKQQGLRWADNCEGLGNINSVETNPQNYEQKDFKNWIDGTSYLQHLAKSFNIPDEGRVRIMMMTPRSTYSLHCDPDIWRLHIPLVTSPNAFMFVDQKLWHLPIGNAYLVHVGDYHLALNTGLENRIHLVFDNCSNLA